jgi:atypical dual specificity phosphatase
MPSFFSKPQPPQPAVLKWVIPGQLAIGSFPNASTYPLLLQAGIQTILTLCTEAEGILPPAFLQTFKCIHYPLADSHMDTTIQIDQLQQAVNLVHQSLSAQRPLYIHCLAGIERSPTVCAAYLCLHHHIQPWEALQWLRQVNPRTRLIESQIQVIQQLTQRKAQ